MNKIELLKKFSTPIWLCQLNGVTKINKDFLKFFYELKKKDPKGIQRSNMLGWHSNFINIKESEPHMNFLEK